MRRSSRIQQQTTPANNRKRGFTPTVSSSTTTTTVEQNMRAVRSTGSTTVYHNQPMSNQHREAKGLVIDELPFYEFRQTLVSPCLMPPTPRSPENYFSVRFQVPPNFVRCMDERRNGRRKYQLQCRVYRDRPFERQEITYPDNFDIKVDGVVPSLPDMVVVSEGRRKVTRRPPLPVDLTHTARPFDRQHALDVRWSSARPNVRFVLMVVLVEVVDVPHLSGLCLRQPKLHQETLRMIRRSLGDEGDISVDHLSISLLDPYARVVMRLPARSTDCDHIQCFDLDNFITINQKQAKWKCPVCSKNIQFSTVRVDSYFERILRDSNKAFTEVELLKDGTWKRLGAHDDSMVCLDSDDEERTEQKPPVHNHPTSSTPSTSAAVPTDPRRRPSNADSPLSFLANLNTARKLPEVITLSDSDDDEPPQQPMSRKRSPHSQTPPEASSSYGSFFFNPAKRRCVQNGQSTNAEPNGGINQFWYKNGVRHESWRRSPSDTCNPDSTSQPSSDGSSGSTNSDDIIVLDSDTEDEPQQQQQQQCKAVRSSPPEPPKPQRQTAQEISGELDKLLQLLSS